MYAKEGSNGIVEDTSSRTVTKRCKRKATGYPADVQKEIHKEALGILADPFYTILKVPFLVEGPLYEMQRIDVDTPIFLGESGLSFPRLTEELMSFWRSMWYLHGYAAWDFELYLQEDGSVMMIDFDKFKKNLEPGFFVHPSFPRNFKELLGNI
jgi:hypothetical protein